VFIYQFDRSTYEGVDLTAQEWKDTINHFRNYEDFPIYKTNYELGCRLEKAEYIYGAMRGGNELEQKECMQLCIKKMSMSTPVSYDLKGIIYIIPE